MPVRVVDEHDGFQIEQARWAAGAFEPANRHEVKTYRARGRGKAQSGRSSCNDGAFFMRLYVDAGWQVCESVALGVVY